jgi:hypothetical protein
MKTTLNIITCGILGIYFLLYHLMQSFRFAYYSVKLEWKYRNEGV